MHVEDYRKQSEEIKRQKMAKMTETYILMAGKECCLLVMKEKGWKKGGRKGRGDRGRHFRGR